jgi:hypothetical protein
MLLLYSALPHIVSDMDLPRFCDVRADAKRKTRFETAVSCDVIGMQAGSHNMRQ